MQNLNLFATNTWFKCGIMCFFSLWFYLKRIKNDALFYFKKIIIIIYPMLSSPSYRISYFPFDIEKKQVFQKNVVICFLTYFVL